MYATSASTSSAMAPPQKPETFLLSDAAQQSLPQDAQLALQQVDNLKYFLISAPVDWTQDQYIRRFLLPTGEYVSCVLWNNLFHISGTDIVRCLSFRFQAFGRPVKNAKKFEEGIFSDLRNLKSGTDASLEEPKSAFLDFMYKNNCIRTQKKQKVFYWYSVPHDRLFLDALERDLKREKMGQEATTMAVNEPALSFEFDASKSLFEQLTKAQQANTSSFGASATLGLSASPDLQPLDAQPLAALPEDVAYHHGALPTPPPQTVPSGIKASESEIAQYERSRGQLGRMQRHPSVPAYMEYSPAPSYASSQNGDYVAYAGQRDLSYEPASPPRAAAPEPPYAVYAGAEPQTYGAMMPMAPPGAVPYGSTAYASVETSPMYRQRPHPSSSSPANYPMPHAPVRQSDLRRSVSVSVGPEDGDRQASYGPYSIPPDQYPHYARPVSSRQGTPLQTHRDGSPASLPHHAHSHSVPHGMSKDSYRRSQGQYYGQPASFEAALPTQSLHVSPTNWTETDRTGPVRRARSHTAGAADGGPYAQKSHSCPIPACGRLFKRLEHLKRHVRTHTQERPYVCSLCSKAFSRSDNLAQHRRTHETRADGEPVTIVDEGLEAEEKEFGSLDDASSSSISPQEQLPSL